MKKTIVILFILTSYLIMATNNWETIADEKISGEWFIIDSNNKILVDSKKIIVSFKDSVTPIMKKCFNCFQRINSFPKILHTVSEFL